MDKDETYLGDGLYASFDGVTIWLRAPRHGGDHEVALEPEVLRRFFTFIDRLDFGPNASKLGWVLTHPKSVRAD